MYQNPISNKIQINNPKAKKQQAYISLKTLKELTQINKQSKTEKSSLKLYQIRFANKFKSLEPKKHFKSKLKHIYQINANIKSYQETN